MISASSLERVAACPKSAQLPQVESPSADSERGTNVHRYLANVISGKPAFDGVAPKYRDLCAAIDLSKVPAVGCYDAEVAFAFDVVLGSARRLTAVNREYDIRPTEIPGTADAVGLTADRVVVIDWKGAWSKATAAADNLQLRFYALCAARVYGKDSATVAIARVAEDRIRWDVAELSLLDLESFASELSTIYHDAQSSQRMVEGEHCRYCPAFDSCPAKQALMRSFATPDLVDAYVGVAIESLDDSARAEVWRKICAFEAVLDRAKERMRESIARNPIRYGDRAIVMVEEERRSVDAAKAIELAPELGAIVKRTLTLGDCEKALGKSGMARIADAVKVSRFTKVKEVDAKKLEAANA